MSPINLGVTVEVRDERPTFAAPTATDPMFLVHSDIATAATFRDLASARDAVSATPALVAMVDAYFHEGGAVLHAVPLVEDDGPDIPATVEAMPETMGPGQIVAPEINSGDDMAALADFAWESNRVYIADGPDGAQDAALITLAGDLRDATGARAAMLVADTLEVPGTAGSPREVPASVVVAAMMARNDIATGNPGLAAAGTQGQARYATGIADGPRTRAALNTLAEHGINGFQDVHGNLRNYGYRTTADPTTLPLWWDMSGSRVIMAVRAREAAVSEDFVFQTVDAGGVMLARFESRLAAELAELQRVDALFGTPTDPGYSVVAGWGVNPREDVAQGIIRAHITLRSSVFAEDVRLSITRRPITEEVTI